MTEEVLLLCKLLGIELTNPTAVTDTKWVNMCKTNRFGDRFERWIKSEDTEETWRAYIAQLVRDCEVWKREGDHMVRA